MADMYYYYWQEQILIVMLYNSKPTRWSDIRWNLASSPFYTALRAPILLYWKLTS